jgi:EpsI family protein
MSQRYTVVLSDSAAGIRPSQVTHSAADNGRQEQISRQTETRMKINPVQAIVASLVILSAGLLAEAFKPQQLMASPSTVLDLEKAIPRQFGDWKSIPNVGLVTPTDAPAADRRLSDIYSQEVARGYADREGNVVMLLVAYGPVQDGRLKAHFPEVCYNAAGFRVSKKVTADVSYQDGVAPLVLSRLTAAKERRFEPISYWMRVGNDVATGVFDRQIARLKYGLRGLIPDGALIRVSTVGLAEDVSFRLQDKFIRDLIAALPPENRKFFVGSNS